MKSVREAVKEYIQSDAAMQNMLRRVDSGEIDYQTQALIMQRQNAATVRLRELLQDVYRQAQGLAWQGPENVFDTAISSGPKNLGSRDMISVAKSPQDRSEYQASIDFLSRYMLTPKNQGMLANFKTRMM